MASDFSSARNFKYAKPASGANKSERTRTAILDAAFEFLWSNPFREMTVARLMAETSISRPAFYQYFADVHELILALLDIVEAQIFSSAGPWFSNDGDPVALLYESLAREVKVCYRSGPFLKAISDAAGNDPRLEKAWNALLGRFDDAVSERIAADQALGLVEPFDPYPVAVALNRVDAYTFIQAFGQRPRRRPETVLEGNARVWISSIYGQRWVEQRSSTLFREQSKATDALAGAVQIEDERARTTVAPQLPKGGSRK